jgi:hypothetical protein
LQNPHGFRANDFHPQKLIRLVGCRMLNAQQQDKNSTAFKCQNGTPRQSQLK